MSNTSVLIVGAGPTGLFLAYQLARHGVAFRIIDQKPEPTQHSNAMAVQTRTLEIFNQSDIVDDFFAQGQRCESACMYQNGKLFTELPFSHIDSVFPFVLTIPQNITEKIFLEKLNETHHHIERNKELIDVTQSNTCVTAIIRHTDGIEETITCDWLVGCDGAHSTVRNESDFIFPGDDIDAQFVVADAEMSQHLSSNNLHLFNNEGKVLGAFPFGDNRFRIAGNLSNPPQDESPNEDAIKTMIDERTRGLFQAKNVTWISPFWIHSKIANHMRDGRIFIAGDASHIHSPAGGQGMNTGIQDAYNLAWKLALVTQGRASAEILDSYQAERHPVISEVVESTEKLTKMQLSKQSFMGIFRKAIFKGISHIAYFRKKILMQMSQLAIHYANSPIIDYTDKFSKSSPKTGERAPDVAISDEDTLYTSFKDVKHHLLVFTYNKQSKSVIDQAEQLYAQIARPFKDVIEFHLITPEQLTVELTQIVDPDYSIHQKYGVNSPAVILVRPDGYIGYKSKSLTTKPVEQHLEQYMSGVSNIV